MNLEFCHICKNLLKNRVITKEKKRELYYYCDLCDIERPTNNLIIKTDIKKENIDLNDIKYLINDVTLIIVNKECEKCKNNKQKFIIDENFQKYYICTQCLNVTIIKQEF